MCQNEIRNNNIRLKNTMFKKNDVIMHRNSNKNHTFALVNLKLNSMMFKQNDTHSCLIQK